MPARFPVINPNPTQAEKTAFGDAAIAYMATHTTDVPPYVHFEDDASYLGVKYGLNIDGAGATDCAPALDAHLAECGGSIYKGSLHNGWKTCMYNFVMGVSNEGGGGSGSGEPSTEDQLKAQISDLEDQLASLQHKYDGVVLQLQACEAKLPAGS